MISTKTVARNIDPQEAVNEAARRYADQRHHRRAVRVVIYLDDDTKCLWPIPNFGGSSEMIDNQCRLSDDGRTLLWFGRRFNFTQTQSPIIALLLSAWEEGTRDVSQDILLRAAASDSVRLEYLFRRNPAWGQIVVQGDTIGMFRLAEPDEIAGW